MLGIRKGTHIVTNLRDNGRCRSYINARYGTQKTQRLFVLYDLFRNSVLHSMAVLFKSFQVLKYHAKEAALVLRERTVQGDQYFVDSFPGLCFQTLVQRLPRDTSVFHEMTDDVSPGSAKCVRQKRCEAETGALQEFIDAILLGGNVANDALTIPGQMPQLPERFVWDKTPL